MQAMESLTLIIHLACHMHAKLTDDNEWSGDCFSIIPHEYHHIYQT